MSTFSQPDNAPCSTEKFFFIIYIYLFWFSPMIRTYVTQAEH